jgi:hypothetical protein
MNNEDFIKYEKDGIKILADPDKMTFHKNGLKIEIPMSVMTEFADLLTKAHEDIHAELAAAMGIHVLHDDTHWVKTREDLRKYIIQQIKEHKPMEAEHAEHIADIILQQVKTDDQVTGFLMGYLAEERKNHG